MEFLSRVPVSKGMSGDEKYRVQLPDGRECLMRLSDRERAVRKEAEFRMMERAYREGVPVPEPYALCEYEGKICQLTGWLEGCDLEETDLSGERGRELGRKAADLLKKLHSIPAPENAEPWKERFGRKILVRLEEAAELFGEREDISLLSRYLLDHLDLLEGCGQCFSHGDYNPGNLILQPDGSLGVIDFNAYNGGYGEPVFETAVILSDSRLPEEFRSGFCTGYFGQDVPQQLLDYYLGYSLLAELCETDEEEQERLLVRIGDFCKKIR